MGPRTTIAVVSGSTHVVQHVVRVQQHPQCYGGAPDWINRSGSTSRLPSIFAPRRHAYRGE